MQNMAEQSIIARRRPWRFVSGQISRHPARAPACWMPTAMALTWVWSRAEYWKSRRKESNVRTPPGFKLLAQVG